MQLNSTEPFKLEYAGIHRQPRFGYGPLLGLLLANFLSNSAIAKYAPLGALRLSYEPTPWLSHIRPPYEDSSQGAYNYWHPIKNPYGPPVPPTSVAGAPETQHIHHHHLINPSPNQQQIVTINERPPTEIIIDDDDLDDTDDETVHHGDSYSTITEDNNYNTNIESPHIEEPIAAESIISSVQVTLSPIDNTGTTFKPKYHVKRGAPRRSTRRNKYSPQKRRRYTTTPEYEYDSYEDFTTRHKPTRNRPLDSDEDSSEEYDDYDLDDFTTKPYKKRKRTTLKPKKKQNKNRKKQVTTTAIDDYDDDYETTQAVTHIILRQGQRKTTTPVTMITNGTTDDTTTTPAPPTNSTNTTGYGYGPSNGNEDISITYGPPHGEPQGAYGPPHASYGPPRPSYEPANTAYGPPSSGYFQLPYTDWYSSDATRNAIVKKVNDFIGFDNVFQ